MGKEISKEDMSKKTDAEILALKPDELKECKEDAMKIFNDRKAAIAAGSSAAADPPTSAAGAPAQNTAAEETKAPAATSAAASAGEAAEQKNKGWDANNTGQKTLKLVLTGDTAVGKSCLITNYLNNSFSEDYEPTVLDVFRGIKNVKKKQIEIEIHDTSGDEHLGVNRKVQYKDADCFMICVACNQPSSLDSV